MNILISGNKLRRDGNTPGGLNLVSRQHPDLDPRVPQQLQSRLDIVLQFILNTGQPEQLEVMFKVLRHNSSHRFVPSLEADARLVVLSLKLRVHLCTESLAGHDERPQTFSRHVGRLFLEPVIPLHDLRHHDIRAFLEERDLASLFVPDDDSHSLRF